MTHVKTGITRMGGGVGTFPGTPATHSFSPPATIPSPAMHSFSPPRGEKVARSAG